MEIQTIISVITALLTLLGVGVSIDILHNKVSNKLDDIKTSIVGLLQAKSPTALSEKGEKISKELNATSIINRIYNEIVHDVIMDTRIRRGRRNKCE